jgi:G3E family GTPase
LFRGFLFFAVNIDEYLIKGDDVKLNQKEEKMVAMQNGCICCTLREDLLIEIAKLAKEGRFDYLVIESTGISEPMPVAETFTFNTPATILGNAHRPLSDIARLDTMVTVIDALNFYKDLSSVEMVAERENKDKMEVADEDNRSIAHLLVDQVEFANVILLNKMDLVSEGVAAEIEALLHRMNPRAKIFRTQHSQIAFSEVINTGAFDMEGFTDVLLKEHGVLAEAPPARRPESLEYGISSFVYRREKPFHPDRLNEMLGTQLPNVLRCKGICWLAHRNNMVVDWNGVSEIIFLEPGGPWAADMAEDERSEIPQHLLSRIRPDDPFGDRRQELVIIGKDLDRTQVESILDKCLLTDDEMKEGPEAWEQYEDPFGLNLEDDEEDFSYNTNLGQGDSIPSLFSSSNLNEVMERVFDLGNTVNVGVATRTGGLHGDLSKWIKSLLTTIKEKIDEREEAGEDPEDDDELALLGEHVSYFEGDLSDKKLFLQFKKGLRTLITEAFAPIVGKKQAKSKSFLSGLPPD